MSKLDRHGKGRYVSTKWINGQRKLSIGYFIFLYFYCDIEEKGKATYTIRKVNGKYEIKKQRLINT